jgi:hypothetical protein
MRRRRKFHYSKLDKLEVIFNICILVYMAYLIIQTLDLIIKINNIK